MSSQCNITNVNENDLKFLKFWLCTFKNPKIQVERKFSNYTKPPKIAKIPLNIFTGADTTSYVRMILIIML